MSAGAAGVSGGGIKGRGCHPPVICWNLSLSPISNSRAVWPPKRGMWEPSNHGHPRGGEGGAGEGVSQRLDLQGCAVRKVMRCEGCFHPSQKQTDTRGPGAQSVVSKDISA